MTSFAAIVAITLFILMPCSLFLVCYLCRKRGPPPAGAGEDADELWNLAIAEMARALRERGDEEDIDAREMKNVVAGALRRCEELLGERSLVLEKENLRPQCELASQSEETWEEIRDTLIERMRVAAGIEAASDTSPVEGASKKIPGGTDPAVQMEEGSQGGVEEGVTDQPEHTHIAIPSSGGEGGTREVPIHCAICLVQYKVSDEVCWASNPKCPHVFHRECMSQWLASFLRVQAKKKADTTKVDCPMCRQDFFKIEKRADQEAVSTAQATMPPITLAA